MNVTIRNVPDKVHKATKRAAKEQGRSLNAHIIHTLEAEVAEIERRKPAANWRKRVDEFAASLPAMDDSTPLISQERQRR
jgi:plasmid stability protein